MATLPSAITNLNDQAAAFGGSTGYIVAMGPVSRNADMVPRVFGSAKGLLDQHGYAPAVDYCAEHIKQTKKPVVFVGLPVATPGAVLSEDDSKVIGTSTITVTAGLLGIMEETEAVVSVTKGGTVGTHGIELDVSMDKGRTSQKVRLGTAVTYAIPFLGIVLNFGAGTLLADDVLTFKTSAPMFDAAAVATARANLAAQQKYARSWLMVGEVASLPLVQAIQNEVNAYKTANERFLGARISIKDTIEPFASKTKLSVAMVGAPDLTFLEVGASGDTITRSAGSWITDGFQVGMTVTIDGSVGNNVTGNIAALSALVLTFDTTDLLNEGPAAGCSVVGSDTLTFAEVGASGDTVTRSAGSWIAEGFKVGDDVTVVGTASNNVTGNIAALSALVLTFDTTDLVAEEIASHLVSVTKGQSYAAYLTEQDALYATVDAEPRVNLGVFRGKMISPITGHQLRRPSQWFASLRQYSPTIDLHVPTFRKSDGPLQNCSLVDANGIPDEFDERTQAGALAARFTCLRTWSNGPNGSFVALDLTRAAESSLLSRQHNMDVANLACTIVQLETENMVGQVLQLQRSGLATEGSLQDIEARINVVLQNNLLVAKGNDGPRASSAVWRASRADNLGLPGAKLNGVLSLVLNGTLETIETAVRVITGGGA
jgi:hypothetical protein